MDCGAIHKRVLCRCERFSIEHLESIKHHQIEKERKKHMKTMYSNV